jgi:hypothetical protein
MRHLPRSLTFTLLAASVAFGSSLQARDLPLRAAQADRVVLAEVLGSQVHVPDGDVRRMTTVTSVVVLEDLKGQGPRRLELVQLGGESGLWRLHVSGEVAWVPGETAVLFLRCRDAAHPQRCTVSGLAQGKVRVVGRIGAQDALVSRDEREPPVRLRLEELVDRVKMGQPRRAP